MRNSMAQFLSEQGRAEELRSGSEAAEKLAFTACAPR
jgi:hypothetical protein